MIWCVTIKCWFVRGKGHDSIRRRVEVEADNHETAIAAAIDFCDTTAHSSKSWTRFEFIKSHSMPPIKYPREAIP